MWSAILSAEDSRPTIAQALGPLAGGLRYPDAEIRRIAVRGLGRQERDTIRTQKALLSIIDLIASALSDSSVGVRAEAANAIAQAAQHVTPDAARDSLLAHLKTEQDPRVRGEIAQALARLPYQAPVSAIEAALLQISADTALPAVLGAARGYDALYRGLGKNSAPSTEAVARLNQLARYNPKGRGQGTRPDSVARVRRLAVAALLNSRRLDPATLAAAAADADPQVRRMGVVALGALDSVPDRAKALTAALRDASPMVRYDAVRVYGQRLQATAGCAPLVQALADKNPHVVLLAIDLMGAPCENALKQQVTDRLGAYAEQLAPAYGVSPASTQTWHQPAHAIVSLARVSPERATTMLPKFSGHTTWWVRMYAARAAAALKDAATLTRLAYDENDNVREAAVAGLSAVSGHAVDSVYIAALARKDYQLQITAAKALEGTPNPDKALAALNAALQRVTGENRETSRDARMAMLERIGTLGGPSQVSQIQLYLYDWDPAIARQTATILTRWAGTPQEATPTALEYPKLPGLARIAELTRSKAVFHMRGGGVFEMTLRPLDAATNVERFARLAAAGYFDGLTFHRVVPNFVIQGGSPAANEYYGDGPFTRDELTTEEHLRGTVGISTRGRDTGDGQLFVNLVDNPRLDHQYTIIGEITSGLDVVDGLLEGATMEKVEIVPR
jgi:cyclophilin family peptidyl-prolyl cis-trans isomerase/HEAT repeat protein